MDNKKTLLTRQKTLIIVIACLACIVAVACLVFPYVFKEKLNTVYAYSEQGDSVEVAIFDKVTGRSLKGDITAMLAGEMKNTLFVKPGKEDGVLYTFNKNDVEISYRPYIVPEVPKENIRRITVTNDKGTFSVYNDGKGNFFVEGAESNLYNQQLLSNLLFQARYLLADSYVENASEMSDYGLTDEKCGAKISVETTDGKAYCLLVGDRIAEGGQFYMRHTEKEYVYVMDSGAEIFFEDMRIYLDPVVIRPIEEQTRNYIEKFAYAKNGEPFFACEIIPDAERVGAYINQLHRMTYPADAFVLNTTTLYEMFNQIGGLSGAGVVEHGVFSGENPGEVLDKYGLVNTAADIAFTLGGESYRIVVGNTEEYDGELYYYVYSEYQDTVVMVPATSMTFLQYNIIDLFQENVFQYNINEVASIQVKTPGKTREYVLSGEGETLTVTENGKTVDTPSFRQFYISLLGVKIAGYSKVEGSGSEMLDHVLSYVVTLRSGDVLHFDFYSESTMNCYMVVDGKGGFKTDRKQINKIAEYSEMLINGQKIESLLG